VNFVASTLDFNYVQEKIIFQNLIERVMRNFMLVSNNM